MTSKLLKLIGIVLLIALLAACGGDDESEDDNDSGGNNDTNNVTTPADNADDSSDSQLPNLELTETYTTTNQLDAEYSFNLPAGWIVDESLPGIIAIHSTQDASQNLFRGLESGQVVLQITTSAVAPDEAVTEHNTSFASGIGVELSESVETTIAGKPAARVDGTDSKYHLRVVSVVWDDTYVDVNTYTNPDEFSQYEQTLLDIISSISYTPGVQ